MKILILGVSGTIGNAIYRQLSGRYEVYGTYNKNKPDIIDVGYLQKYDIADRDILDTIFNDIKPDLIISALTGDFEQQLNVHKRICEFLCESSGRCIFISTANVFDGSPNGCKTEVEIPYPISSYGKFKYSCEQLLQSHLGNKYLIIRLPRTFGPTDIYDEIKQLEKSKSIFNNLYLSYNTAANAAKAIQFCIEENKSGIVHLTSNDSILKENFMKSALSILNMNLVYTSDSLTIEKYCMLFGCDNPDLLRYDSDGYFNLSLKSNDNDIVARFGISCENVISSLLDYV